MRGLTHRIGRLFVIAGGASLGALHVAVLFRRVADGTLLKPLVMAQWLVTLGLVAAAILIRRRGISIFRGRPAAALWIVVALMHGMVAMPGGPGFVGVLGTVSLSNSFQLGAGLLVAALVALAGVLGRSATPVSSQLEMRRAAAELLPALPPQSALAARAPPA